MSFQRPLLRFLLPRLQARTYASTPKTLAKPTKFTPPSHRSRRPADPTNYPGPAIKQDASKHYPNTLPPPNTWAYYLLTSRRLHFYLSLGILAALAGTVTISNFLRTSPFARDIKWSWSDPFDGLKHFGEAWKKSVEVESERTAALRKKLVQDVEKRGEYRRSHGLEQAEGEGVFGALGTMRSGEDQKTRAETAAVEVAAAEIMEEGISEGWVELELKKAEEAAGETENLPAVEVEKKAERKEERRWW